MPEDNLEEAMVLAPGYMMGVRRLPIEVTWSVDVCGEGQCIFRIVPKLVLGVVLAEVLLMVIFKACLALR